MSDDIGRYQVGKHWGRPCVYDGNHVPSLLVRVHDTEADAHAHAAHLNTPRQTTRPAQQTALFDTQEV